jgi:hypothetical protein
MAGKRYEGQAVHIALFAGDRGFIRDATFERCDIKGPAVIVPWAKRLATTTASTGPLMPSFGRFLPSVSKVIGAMRLRIAPSSDATS